MMTDPTAGPSARSVLVVDGDADRVAGMARTVRESGTGVAVLDARDGRTGLRRLETIRQEAGGYLPAVLIVYADPKSWAAAVIITAVNRIVPHERLQLVLVAEGPLEALPLRVTDFPGVALVLPNGDPTAAVIDHLVHGKPGHAALFRVIERLAAILSALGMPRMPARVLAGLLVTDSGRLTASELAGLLQVNPSSVSSAVRYLTRFNLATREREPGSRKDHFRVPDNVWIDAMAHHHRALELWKSQAQQGIELFGADTPPGERLAETVAFLDFVLSSCAELYEKWRNRTTG